MKNRISSIFLEQNKQHNIWKRTLPPMTNI